MPFYRIVGREHFARKKKETKEKKKEKEMVTNYFLAVSVVLTVFVDTNG